MRPPELEPRAVVNRNLRMITALGRPSDIAQAWDSAMFVNSANGKDMRQMPLRRKRPNFPRYLETFIGKPVLFTEGMRDHAPAVLNPSQAPEPLKSVVSNVSRKLMEDRIHEQNLTYLDFAQRGFIPPPWKVYGRRHREEIDRLRGLQLDTIR